MDNRFGEIIALIQSARSRAYKAVNKELINLYWNVGAYISEKLATAQWGDKTVDELARHIQNNYPELKGFNRRGLYRMRQFYEAYKNSEILSSARTQLQVAENQNAKIVSSSMTQFKMWDISGTLLSEIAWTHHLMLLAKCQSIEEKIFYILLCIRENYFDLDIKNPNKKVEEVVYDRMAIIERLEKSFAKSTLILNELKEI